MTREIRLTRGLVALVDDEDFDRVAVYSWYPKKNERDRTCYAISSTRRVTGKKTTILMHREITGAPAGAIVDHIDGDGLNNKRENLRIVTSAQNCQHRTRKASGCSSRFKGVSRYGGSNKWRASIQVNKLYVYLGLFETEEAARDAYAVAAARYHGDFAAPHVESEDTL